MNTKHTPGPWSACCIHLTPHYVFAGDADTTICRIKINDPKSDSFEPMSGTVTLDQSRANARLIAAAPELLEALQAAENYLVERGVDVRGVTGRTVILPKMQAAIAKATGKGGA